MRSYCDMGDVFCDSGDNQTVHRLYWVTDREDAVNFIWSKFNDSKAAASPTSGTTGTPPTPTGSSNPNSGTIFSVPQGTMFNVFLAAIFIIAYA
jgi:Cutinase